MEYARLGDRAPPPIRLEDVVDTLPMARRKHPGAANNLDALCSRYGIDNTKRTKHGALLDAQILAEVYVELLGGKQTSLGLLAAEVAAPVAGSAARQTSSATPRPYRGRLTEAERARHDSFRASLGPAAIWADYIGADDPA
jgi:DNA polymerase-3 subunit epsilon